jgi:hypothetical protein
MAVPIFSYLVTIVDWSALMDKMGAMVFHIVTFLLNSVTLIVYRQWINKERGENMTPNENMKICDKGHTYVKKSDCPTCPICEKERKPETGFLSVLSAPARRALENNGLTSLQTLSTYSEKEILAFHGMGPSSIPKLRKVLGESGLSFRE